MDIVILHAMQARLQEVIELLLGPCLVKGLLYVLARAFCCTAVTCRISLVYLHRVLH